MFRQIILGKPFIETRQLLQKTEFWTKAELIQLQKDLLFYILKHAAEHVPYYKKHIDKNLFSGSKDAFELIKNFPIIEKKIVKENINTFLFGAKYRHYKATTGGSTGQPFMFYLDRFKTRQIEKAFIFNMWNRVGYKFGDSIFNLRGRAPRKGKFISRDRFFNIYFASSFNLRSDTVSKYVDSINKIKPRFLHGYPSTMYQLASLMKQKGLRLKYVPCAVFCGSEKLFHYQRKLIENIFSCRAFSWYGHSEYLVLGGECESSHALHLYPQYGYIELFPTGSKNAQGKEIYEIIATGFNNHIMPLIRYRTGDYAILSDNQTCSCGRNYLLLDEVIGREQEFIVDNDGQVVSVTSLIFGQHFSIFDGINGLYIEQYKPGNISIIMEENSGFSEKKFKEMQLRITCLIGDRFSISYRFTDQLPKSPIGKAKLVHQHLNIKNYLESIH